MASADAALVVIECPHCGTRYQLPYEAIGTKGRTVACAHCGNSWEAHAARPISADTKLQALAEEELDAKMVEEERREQEKHAAAARRKEAAGKPGSPARGKERNATVAEDDTLPADLHRETVAELDAAATDKPTPSHGKTAPPDHRRRQSDFSKRQQSLYSTLPRAKARRLLRYSALGAVVVVFGGGILFRENIVTQFPQLAAPYAAIGLPVNVVGLQFADVRTLESLQDGTPVLVVDGSVQSVANRAVAVPPVVVTLFDRKGISLYAWGVTPKVSILAPGEAVAFETRLSGPPANATDVTLSFGAGSGAAKPAAGAIADDGTGAGTNAASDGTRDNDKDGGGDGTNSPG
jgi:predicted Zn finger-like uncharacterized protein